MYCLYPLVVLLCELRLVYLRSNLQNQSYAHMTNVQTALLAIFSVAGAFFGGVTGLIAGQYVAYITSYLVLVWRHPLSRLVEGNGKAVFDKKEYWYIALISSFNNGLSQALSILGTFFIGLFLASDLAVASYKVATTIPFALLFIPSTMMTYVYPYFALHCNDGVWTRRQYLRLSLACIGVMGVATLVAALFGRPIIGLVFGEQYLDAVPAFQVLMFGFFLTAALRQPAGNFLVTQKKLLANTVIAIISIILNIVLSYVLIPSYQLVGAAWAYTGTMLFGAVAAPWAYVHVIRKL